MQTPPEPATVPNFSAQAKASGPGAMSGSGSSLFNLVPQDNSEQTRLLRLAGTLLARSRRLESRIGAIETAFQTCKCAKVVSDSILDILETAKVLLFKMRDISDPRARAVLVKAFNALLKQIDAIVLDGHYDDKNLARGDSVVIATDESRHQSFQIAGFDMSSRGLLLQPFEGELISNADIVDRLTKVEAAANCLVAHSLSYDTIAFLLQSRMKFARGMIDILEDGNSQIGRSRAGHDAVLQALSQICSAITRDSDAGADAKSASKLEAQKSHVAPTAQQPESVTRTRFF